MKPARDTEIPTPYKRYQNAVTRAQNIAETPSEEYLFTRDLLRGDEDALVHLHCEWRRYFRCRFICAVMLILASGSGEV